MEIFKYCSTSVNTLLLAGPFCRDKITVEDTSRIITLLLTHYVFIFLF